MTEINFWLFVYGSCPHQLPEEPRHPMSLHAGGGSVVIRPIPWYSTQTFGSDCEETRCDDTKLLAAHGWTAMELRWAARRPKLPACPRCIGCAAIAGKTSAEASTCWLRGEAVVRRCPCVFLTECHVFPIGCTMATAEKTKVLSPFH
jgi:hypothetical protein